MSTINQNYINEENNESESANNNVDSASSTNREIQQLKTEMLALRRKL